MIIFLQIIWFILPAGVANMSASISAKIFPHLNCPIDFGKIFRGKRIFGGNKTWRGLIAGVIMSGLIFVMQKFLFNSYSFVEGMSFFDYQSASWLLGILFGLGALAGDAVESFIKRQINIASGKSWFLFDQIDWVIGSLFLVYPFTKVPIVVIVLTLSLGVILHIFIKFIGYLIGIEKTPF